MSKHKYRDYGRNQAIILYLQQWLRLFFPEIPSIGQRQSGVGGYNNTPGHGAHIEGRAADIYVNVHDPVLKRIGDGLFRMFMENSRELGVENVTWHDQIWRGPGDPTGPPDAIGAARRFTRGDHDNHLHVSFTLEASQREPPILLTRLDELAHQLGGSGISFLYEE